MANLYDINEETMDLIKTLKDDMYTIYKKTINSKGNINFTDIVALVTSYYNLDIT